jgi:uncharacterized protein YhhL (DUF1145 family)
MESKNKTPLNGTDPVQISAKHTAIFLVIATAILVVMHAVRLFFKRSAPAKKTQLTFG